MNHTVTLRRPSERAPVRLSAKDLDTAFRAFFEVLGGRRPRREPPVTVIQARRHEPTRAEIVAASYLGAPAAFSPLLPIAEDREPDDAA